MPTPPDDSARYPRWLFNTAESCGATPFPYYHPTLIGSLVDAQGKTDRQLFDLINEAAVRHDPGLQDDLKLHEKELGYIPRLAVAHYKWVFGDKSQLDWLLAEGKKHGLGGDSLILIVFGYMDEWDKTIRWLKQMMSTTKTPIATMPPGAKRFPQPSGFGNVSTAPPVLTKHGKR